MKSAPTLCVLLLIIGGGVAALFYEKLRLPTLEAHIRLLQDRLSAKENNQIHDTVNVKGTKQAIRSFLESLDPAILEKVDSRTKTIGVWLGAVSQTKLALLSELPGAYQFLSFEKTSKIWIVSGEGQLGNSIRPKGESGQLEEYLLYPKDALTK